MRRLSALNIQLIYYLGLVGTLPNIQQATLVQAARSGVEKVHKVLTVLGLMSWRFFLTYIMLVPGLAQFQEHFNLEVAVLAFGTHHS